MTTTHWNRIGSFSLIASLSLYAACHSANHAVAVPCTVMKADCVGVACNPAPGGNAFGMSLCDRGPFHLAFAETKEVAMTTGSAGAPAQGQQADAVEAPRVQCRVNGNFIFVLGCTDTFVGVNVGDGCNLLRGSGGSNATHNNCGQDGEIEG
jgi:hypothetical protein